MTTLRNQVHLIGNLGKDPVFQTLDSGRMVAKVSIATKEVYRNAKGEKITETQWHNLVAWGKTAELMSRYLKKGNEIAVQGKITNRTYDGKDGISRNITEIVVKEFVMFGGAQVAA